MGLIKPSNDPSFHLEDHVQAWKVGQLSSKTEKGKGRTDVILDGPEMQSCIWECSKWDNGFPHPTLVLWLPLKLELQRICTNA